MNYPLKSKHLQKENEFRDFVNEKVIPYSDYNDYEERIHDNVIYAMKASGLLGCMIPKAYGGLGLDNFTQGLLFEQVGRACSSVRSWLTVQGMVSCAILRWGNEQQKKKWLPRLASGKTVASFGLSESNAGSDANSIETTALLDGDSFILNGNKKWITMAQLSDLFLIFAKVDGKPTTFLVERNSPGIEITPMFGLLGAKASMIAEIAFNDCRIPKENMLGQQGSGISHIALTCLDYGRYTIAWGCVGLAQACLEYSVQHANSRIQFDRKIGENQLIQKMITEMSVNIKASRLLCSHAGNLRDVNDPDSIIETWNAKYFVSTKVNEIASNAVQIHGANGCHNSYPIERLFRDARINEVIEGTTQLHEQLIASQEYIHSQTFN